METVTASFTWPGPDVDVLRLFVEPTPVPWGADPLDDDVVLFRVLDERQQETDRLAGLEIVGFLRFDRWGDLPDLPMRWKLPDEDALPLVELLRRIQRRLRESSAPPTPVATRSFA